MIKKQQLVDQVIEYLSNMIASGTYKIGDKLPTEPKLMEELGVGRSTLREAIRALAHNEILDVRQGDGTYIRSLHTSRESLVQRLRRAKVNEVLEVRRTLELEISRLACLRRGKRHLQRIRSLLKARNAALAQADMQALLDADVAFHCALAEATGNEVLADLYKTFALSIREALTTLWDAVDHEQPLMAALHEELVEAIAVGDAPLAANITSSLLDRHTSTLSEANKIIN
ncbi:MAG: FadR/GntR family transcriptional regulator [Dissulfurispiraceae bacterium]